MVVTNMKCEKDIFKDQQINICRLLWSRDARSPHLRRLTLSGTPKTTRSHSWGEISSPELYPWYGGWADPPECVSAQLVIVLITWLIGSDSHQHHRHHRCRRKWQLRRMIEWVATRIRGSWDNRSEDALATLTIFIESIDCHVLVMKNSILINNKEDGDGKMLQNCQKNSQNMSSQFCAV